MFGKMMNRYFYGKSGQGDYNPDNLPQTRMQLFWEMLRIRFSGLMRLNLLYAIVWLPAIFVIARGLMLWYSSMVSMGDIQAQLDTAAITAEAFAANHALWQEGVRALIMQTLLLLFPCLAITGPFTAGLCYVTRNWARDEHAFIWSDYKDAVRENWKPALITSVITGFMPLLVYVCATFYGQMVAQSVLYLVPQVLCIMLGVIWMLMQVYTYPQIVTYTLTYKNMLKNSLFMAVGRLPMTVGLKLACLAPALICAAVGLLTPYFQYALLALGLYYIVIGFSLSRFVGASYSNAVFDRLINTRLDGVEVNRGLYHEEDENVPADDEARL